MEPTASKGNERDCYETLYSEPVHRWCNFRLATTREFRDDKSVSRYRLFSGGAILSRPLIDFSLDYCLTTNNHMVMGLECKP